MTQKKQRNKATKTYQHTEQNYTLKPKSKLTDIKQHTITKLHTLAHHYTGYRSTQDHKPTYNQAVLHIDPTLHIYTTLPHK